MTALQNMEVNSYRNYVVRVLTAILEENEQYQQFQEKFKELFEDDDSQIKAEFENIGNQS